MTVTLDRINQQRTQFFELSHDTTHEDQYGRVACWSAHKALSVVLIPTNSLVAAGGATLMVATSCTLGAFKVFVYAASLGNIEPKFSTGFLNLAEKTIVALYNVGLNGFELLYDAADLGYQGYKGVKCVLVAMKMDYLADIIKDVFVQIGNRIGEGVSIALTDEEKDKGSKLSSLLTSLHIETQMQTQFIPFMVTSCVNIPVQAVSSVALAALSTISATLFASKALLYAATGVHIHQPVYLNSTLVAAALSGRDAIANSFSVVTECAVKVYELVDALGLVKVAATIVDIVAYVPKAICS